jgi:hypothetical protein
MNSKVWYTSKLLWTGVLSVLISILSLAGTSPLFDQHLDLVLFLQGVLVIVFRALSSESLRLKP